MKHFKDFASYNEYVGLARPSNDNLDMGYYSDRVLLKSDAIMVDFYRISIKRKYIDRNLPDYPNPITAAFFSSPDKPLEWDIEYPFEGIYLHISKHLIEEHRFLFKNYLDYGVHEALYLTSTEEKEVGLLFDLMFKHYQSQQDNYSLLLSYAHTLVSLVESFYQRQFSTQTVKYNRIVSDFQQLLQDYYQLEVKQLPSVQYFADKLHLSPNYLGDIIKHFTNKSAIETIHDLIIKRARQLLLESDWNNSEIAYQLGFEYPNYFARFFKKNTRLSPREFRNQFAEKSTTL